MDTEGPPVLDGTRGEGMLAKQSVAYVCDARALVHIRIIGAVHEAGLTPVGMHILAEWSFSAATKQPVHRVVEVG